MAIFKDPPPEKVAAQVEESMPLLGKAEGVAKVAQPEEWWLTEPPPPRPSKPWPKGANASASRIKLALSGCLARFHYRYTDYRPDPSGPAALVGSLVHGAREDAALRRIKSVRGRPVPMIASVEELLHLLEYQPANMIASARKAADKEALARDLTPQVLEEAREVTKAAGEEDFRAALAAEHTFSLQVSRSLLVAGYIDRVDGHGPDRSDPQVVTILDYKSSQELPTREELYYDPQPGLYLAWARRAYPKAREIRFVIRNLRHRQDTAPLVWSEAHDAMILAIARSAHHTWSDPNMRPAVVGEHCKHCPYREGDARHKPCPAYERELERLSLLDDAEGGLDRLELADLMVVYREAAVGADLMEERRSAARKEILAKLGDQKNYRTADLLAIVSQDRVRDYRSPTDMVKELAEATGADFTQLATAVLRVSREKLDGFVKGASSREEAERIVERYQSLSLGSKKLQVRRSQSMF
jgi:hypothetical protein